MRKSNRHVELKSPIDSQRGIDVPEKAASRGKISPRVCSETSILAIMAVSRLRPEVGGEFLRAAHDGLHSRAGRTHIDAVKRARKLREQGVRDVCRVVDVFLHDALLISASPVVESVSDGAQISAPNGSGSWHGSLFAEFRWAFADVVRRAMLRGLRMFIV
jgi:hypothetical protein